MSDDPVEPGVKCNRCRLNDTVVGRTCTNCGADALAEADERLAEAREAVNALTEVLEAVSYPAAACHERRDGCADSWVKPDQFCPPCSLRARYDAARASLKPQESPT